MLGKVWRMIEWMLVVCALGIILSLEWINEWQVRRARKGRK